MKPTKLRQPPRVPRLIELASELQFTKVNLNKTENRIESLTKQLTHEQEKRDGLIGQHKRIQTELNHEALLVKPE